MSLPDLDDLKAHLNKTTSADDAELTDILDAAVDVTESLVGPVSAVTVTETHYALHSDVLVLRQAPATALTSVSGRLYPGIVATTYTLSDYVLDGPTGVVRLATGLRFTGDVTVTYTVGRDVVPPSMALAILVIAAHLWETQRGISPTALQQQDAGLGLPSPMGYALPNRARELLAPFARGPRVA